MSAVRFDEVAEFINGKAFKPSDWAEAGLPIIRIQNLTGTSEKFNYFNGKVEDKFRVKNGDILISWSASLGVYHWHGTEAVLNQHIFKVCPRQNIDSYYFYYASTGKLQEMISQVHGATMQHITKDRFDAISIELPDIAEQRIIAKRLDQADRLRRIRRYALEMSDSFLPAVFVEMFGDLNEMTNRWDADGLDNLGILDRGRSRHRPRDAKHLYGGRYPFIQTGDVANAHQYIKNHNQTYSEEGLKQSKLWPSGTLCITIAANIGDTAILTYPACFPDSIVGFIPGERICIEFVQYWMKLLQEMLQRTAPEVAQKNINLEILRGLRCPVPPLDLQKKFLGVVTRYERLRSTQLESLRQAEHLFQSLLHQAFGDN